MNIHKNAKTTPNMRALIVTRHQAGETPRTIARAVGVSPTTVYKWLKRFRNEGMAGVKDRTSRPRRRQPRVTAGQAHAIEGLRLARQTGLSRATVARIAKAKGLSTWPSSIPASRSSVTTSSSPAR